MRTLLVLPALLLLAACAGQPDLPSAVKVGKPYTVQGKTYYPSYDETYEETGLASWYGPGFHGNKTANGETFNTNDYTAAHPTLPMPSLVRVSNLENGRSLVVRINDRGPFKEGRIIDLSKAAARELGVLKTGVAEVKVEYLKDATETYWAERGITPKGKAPETQPVEVASVPAEPVQAADLAPAAAKQEENTGNGFSLIREANAAEDTTVVDQSWPTEEKNDQDTTDGISPVADEVAKHPNKPTAVRLYSPEGKVVSNSGEPEPAVAPPPSGQWYVQAGAFSTQKNAESLAKKLSPLGATNVQPLERDGRTLHRVRVGPFATQEEAASAATKAADYGASGARAVKVE